MAEFSIKNNETVPITFDILTVGGRVNDICPNDKCPDFEWRKDVMLKPKEIYSYKGNLKLETFGDYHFFTTYRTKDGKWSTSIPTATGVTNTIDIIVNPSRTKSELEIKKGEIVACELLFNYGDKEIKNLIPLVVFSGGKYYSAWELLKSNNPLRQKILNAKRYWLYYKGNLIGSFNISGSLGKLENGMPSFTGNVNWKSKPPGDLASIAENTIALSEQILQPFYPKNLF